MIVSHGNNPEEDRSILFACEWDERRTELDVYWKVSKKKNVSYYLCCIHVISNLHCDARRRDIYIFYYKKKKFFYFRET